MKPDTVQVNRTYWTIMTNQYGDSTTADSILLAAGILGATVMPHAIYLHSALTQRRVVGKTEAEKKKIFR